MLIRNAAQRRPRAVTRDRATARTVVEELFRLHSGEIYAYLARMLRDDELAAARTAAPDHATTTGLAVGRSWDSFPREPERSA